MLGLHFCTRAFSSCSKRGPLFIAVRGPLAIVASFVAEHMLQTRRLSSCGSWAQLLRSMWDPPRPGLEPVSPALAGTFSTTAPPGKPNIPILSVRKDRTKSLSCVQSPTGTKWQSWNTYPGWHDTETFHHNCTAFKESGKPSTGHPGICVGQGPAGNKWVTHSHGVIEECLMKGLF